MMNFSSVFVIPIPNDAIVDKLSKVHIKKIEGKNFSIIFEVLCMNFLVSFLNCL
jgi:hypothetical protein